MYCKEALEKNRNTVDASQRTKSKVVVYSCQGLLFVHLPHGSRDGRRAKQKERGREDKKKKVFRRMKGKIELLKTIFSLFAQTEKKDHLPCGNFRKADLGTPVKAEAT